MELLDKIKDRHALISVIGLGYVGLPLAVMFSESGFYVHGIDIDQAKIDSINSGESYIEDVESSRLTNVVRKGGTGKLFATTDFDVLCESDVVIICVHTPLSKTKDPDVSHILTAVKEISSRLTKDTLIVLESTTYPGTTLELVLPIVENHGEVQNRKLGSNLFLAFSPERIDPGQLEWTISNTPKVIGGVTENCTEVASALYGAIVDRVVPVSSPTVAEMVKLLENTYRATNIALVNEVAIMCDRLGVDVWEIIEAAKTKPFGFMPFYPGPGLGGHCIPVDPQYLAWKMKTLNYNARFIQLAEEINLSMPEFWVSKIQEKLNDQGKPVKQSEILVLGVSYKKDVSDTRESPALDVIKHLLDKGASVSYFDSRVSDILVEQTNLYSIDQAELTSRIESADCVVILTDHTDTEWDVVRDKATAIVDTRNALGSH